MPVIMEKHLEGRVVLVTFMDPWQSHEMAPLFIADRAHRDAFMLTHPGQKVHLITDFTATTSIANGFLAARNSPSLHHPTAGEGVVVGANAAVRAFASTVVRAAKFRQITFKPTLEDALDYLAEEIEAEKAQLLVAE